MALLQPDTRHGVILYLENISVSFDGYQALNQLNLTLNEGELRCLIGPNGAGKTTMMDIITGKTRPDQGTAYFGQRIDLLQYSEPEIAQLGIGRKFQKPTVFEYHTVRQNLELALRTGRGVWQNILLRLTMAQHARVDELLELIGLQNEHRREAGLMSHGQKQWLELGMLLAQEPKLLLVDEPVAGMTQQETEKTALLLSELAGHHTILLVEHDMEFVRSIAEQVTVLHEGSVLAEGSMDEVQANPDVVRVYLGE
jgi:urea transport system ATP-binding protein